MYEIVQSRKFKKSHKKVTNSGKFERDKFMEIIKYLADGIELPQKYYDHALIGNLAQQRECHISSDMLLLYEVDNENKIIILHNIGNHANLFGL